MNKAIIYFIFPSAPFIILRISYKFLILKSYSLISSIFIRGERIFKKSVISYALPLPERERERESERERERERNIAYKSILESNIGKI